MTNSTDGINADKVTLILTKIFGEANVNVSNLFVVVCTESGKSYICNFHEIHLCKFKSHKVKTITQRSSHCIASICH